MQRVDIIRLAIMELGINFNEATFINEPIYELVNSMFDFAIKDAISNTRLNVTNRVTKLNRSVSSEIEYNGITYYPYQVPDGLVWFQEIKPNFDYKIVGNLIYIATEGENAEEQQVDITYSSDKDFMEQTNTLMDFLVLSLAIKISKPLHKSSQIGELISKKDLAIQKLSKSQSFGNNNIWELEEDENFGIY